MIQQFRQPKHLKQLGLRPLTAATTGRKGGFSSLELLFVMLIIGLAAVVSLPSLLRSQEVYRLVSASGEIQGRLGSVRIQAITRNDDHRLRVVSATSYVIERRLGGSWALQESFQLPAGFTVAATDSAEFHSRGEANPTATFTITDPNSETRQVVVEGSGYIHAQ
jgi:Tfp pilus assembly protein FimT